MEQNSRRSFEYLFDFLAHQVKGKINILMVSKAKLDQGFPLDQYYWMATVPLSVLKGMGMVVVFCYIIEKTYHLNFYQ